MKAVFASNNAHKLVEVRDILRDRFECIYSLNDLGINVEIDETGDTFEANALIKARTICDLTRLVTIADDSGLCVEALGGAPGVYSARYAGEPCNDRANNELLLQNLRAYERSHTPNRKACFVSAVVLCRPDEDRYLCGIGKTHGVITDRAYGDNGFGYDPYFLSDELGITFAQATMEQKNRISHRARALEELIRQL